MTQGSERACFVARVREVVEQGLGLTEVDGDGDWVVRGRTSHGWVRPITTGPGGAVVEVVGAVGVPAKAAVLRELNDLNAAPPRFGSPAASRAWWWRPGSCCRTP